MRHKYHHQHQQQQDEPPKQQRSMAFLPMLCSSSSRKQVKFSNRPCASSSSPSSSITEEPSSPKVGCMGQVKRNNKVIGFPSIISLTNITTSSTNTHHPIKSHQDQNNYTSNRVVKYHKLKRFFSGKSVTTSATSVTHSAARTAASGSQKGRHTRNNSGNNHNNIVVTNNRGSSHQIGKSCRSKVNEDGNGCIKKSNDVGCVVNLVELDPPLPVVKRPVEQGNNGEDNVSTLWKRRSSGAPLKSLKVQVTHHNHGLLPANTV